MPKKLDIKGEDIEAAKKITREAKNADELRMGLSVILPSTLNITLFKVGELIGRSKATVARLRKKWENLTNNRELSGKGWGGRRNAYLTEKEETKFLAAYFEKAAKGEMLVVNEIKMAYEDKVGSKVPKSTVYRMLNRHGWRKIAPRSRHPKADTQKQEEFKKN